MNEIGFLLRTTREENSVNLEEVSADLKIKPIILNNIEEGNIGAFKDVFLLKDYISSYAKYLGLDSQKMIDKFNDYLFEYTSKIPIKEIEKAMNEDSKNDKNAIISPYTIDHKRKEKILKSIVVVSVIIGIILLLLLLFSLFKNKEIVYTAFEGRNLR